MPPKLKIHDHPVFPRKTAQGIEQHMGISMFQQISSQILAGLVQSGITTEGLIEAQELDTSLKGLTGDQYFARRACQLTKALFNEWEIQKNE